MIASWFTCLCRACSFCYFSPLKKPACLLLRHSKLQGVRKARTPMSLCFPRLQLPTSAALAHPSVVSELPLGPLSPPTQTSLYPTVNPSQGGWEGIQPNILWPHLSSFAQKPLTVFGFYRSLHSQWPGSQDPRAPTGPFLKSTACFPCSVLLMLKLYLTPARSWWSKCEKGT